MGRYAPWMLLAATAVVLGACSTTPGPAPVGAAAPTNMVWTYRSDPTRQAHLGYGVPDTDNVGLSFACARKTSAVSLFTSVAKGPAGADAVQLQSGKAKGRYPAKVERSELTGGWDALASIPLADPVLAAFDKTGRISQLDDKTYPQDARSETERAAIRRFFGFCRG